jgi:hypothetical protein
MSKRTLIMTSPDRNPLTRTYIMLAILASGLVLIGPAHVAVLALGEDSNAAPMNNNNNNTLPKSGSGTSSTSAANIRTTVPTQLDFSPQPIWEEKAKSTSSTPIDLNRTRVEFTGHGNLTVPNTGQNVKMTNNGYGVVSGKNPVTVYGREYLFAEDGDMSAITTYYEVVQYRPSTLLGKGLVIAVFDSNATKSLEQFNGMIIDQGRITTAQLIQKEQR